MKRLIYKLCLKFHLDDEIIYQYLKGVEQNHWDYFSVCKQKYEEARGKWDETPRLECCVNAQNHWNDIYDECNKYAVKAGKERIKRDF